MISWRQIMGCADKRTRRLQLTFVTHRPRSHGHLSSVQLFSSSPAISSPWKCRDNIGILLGTLIQCRPVRDYHVWNSDTTPFLNNFLLKKASTGASPNMTWWLGLKCWVNISQVLCTTICWLGVLGGAVSTKARSPGDTSLLTQSRCLSGLMHGYGTTYHRLESQPTALKI